MTTNDSFERCSFSYVVDVDQWEEANTDDYVSAMETIIGKNIHHAIDGEHFDVLSPINFKIGQEVFVVWAVWSYGDSLSMTENGAYEILGVFESETCANELKDHYRSLSDESHSGHLYETSDGQTFSIPNIIPWTGWFDSLEKLEVVSVRVTNPPQKHFCS